MKIILVAVTSVDGKLTKGNDPDIYSWTSKEDQSFFFSLIKKNNLIVMGRKTYESVKNNLKLEPGKLRIVMTRDVKKYQIDSVSGQLEFSDLSPEELIKKIAHRNYKTILLAGGATINGLFLKKNLVDEIYLTLEPRLFGQGTALIEKQLFDIPLQLLSLKKANKNGTLFLKYKVIKNRQ